MNFFSYKLNKLFNYIIIKKTMVLWLLVSGTFAFDPNAEVYKIFTIDTFRNAYEYPFEPWVMEDFVAKMNQKCAEQNLGFQVTYF